MFTKIKELQILMKALGQYNDAKKEAEVMDAKHLLLSKTFWINIIGTAVTLSGLLPMKYSVPATSLLTILARFVTNQPVTLSLDALKAIFKTPETK